MGGHRLADCQGSSTLYVQLCIVAVFVAGVLTITEVMADSSSHGRLSLELYDSGRYMRLDAAAQRALNVLKSKLDANDNFSLFGLLNRAKTPMGKRLCRVGFESQPI
jgi:DNA mismatch repair ATPase MutS